MFDSRPDRGNKHTCQSCEAKFYDLSRSPILCPKCGVEFIEPVRPPPTPRGSRRGWGKDRPEPVAEVEAVEERSDAAELLDDEEEREPDEEAAGRDEEEGLPEEEVAE